MPSPPPVVLSIAGSDCCAGAGIQADLKTCAALGAHCLTAVTAIVSETPLQVTGVFPVPIKIVQEQIRLLLQTYPVAAIKIGMLPSQDHIIAVSETLQETKTPLVLDPVMMSSTGTPLTGGKHAVEVYQRHLLPLARVITPNLPEAQTLLGENASQECSLQESALALSKAFDVAVLVTGGHNSSSPKATDLLVDQGKCWPLSSAWVECSSSHGTGCTLSAALATGLATGLPLLEAAQQAKHFVTEALRRHYVWQEELSPDVLALNQLPPKAFFMT